MRHLFQQVRFDHRLTAHLGRGLCHELLHQLAPPVLIHNDESLFQLFEIFLEVSNLDRLRRQEAMPVGDGAARDPLNLELHRFATVNSEEPPDWAYEPDIAIPPAHALGEGERGNGPRKESRQHIGGFGALGLLHGDNIIAPLGGANLQVFGGKALRPGKPERGRSRLPLLVIGSRLGGTNHFSHFVRLFLGQSLDVQGEPPGGPERSDSLEATSRP